MLASSPFYLKSRPSNLHSLNSWGTHSNWLIYFPMSPILGQAPMCLATLLAIDCEEESNQQPPSFKSWPCYPCSWTGGKWKGRGDTSVVEHPSATAWTRVFPMSLPGKLAFLSSFCLLSFPWFFQAKPLCFWLSLCRSSFGISSFWHSGWLTKIVNQMNKSHLGTYIKDDRFQLEFVFFVKSAIQFQN